MKFYNTNFLHIYFKEIQMTRSETMEEVANLWAVILQEVSFLEKSLLRCI